MIVGMSVFTVGRRRMKHRMNGQPGEHSCGRQRRRTDQRKSPLVSGISNAPVR